MNSILASAWVHNLDPFIFSFTTERFGEIGLRWYGMAYMAGFACGFLLMYWLAKHGRSYLVPLQVTDFITYIVLGTMIGGRLGYVLFYSPDLLTSFDGQFPFWGALKVHEGGMASHGGFLGITAACALFARKYKIKFLHLGDLTVIGGAIGIFFGRVANFINGELPGRETTTDLPWAVKYPTDLYRMTGNPEQLAQLKPAVQEIGISETQWSNWIANLQVARAQVESAIHRLVDQVQQGNEAIRAAIEPVLVARHPSTVYAALFEGLFIFIVLFLFWRRPRKPGVVGSLFLTLYAIVRIGTEQFRLPDAHIGFQLFGLTRGQWLSLTQLLIAIGLLVWTLRRNDKPIGGWGGLLGDPVPTGAENQNLNGILTPQPVRKEKKGKSNS